MRSSNKSATCRQLLLHIWKCPGHGFLQLNKSIPNRISLLISYRGAALKGVKWKYNYESLDASRLWKNAQDLCWTGGSMLSGRQSRQQVKDMLGHQKVSAEVWYTPYRKIFRGVNIINVQAIPASWVLTDAVSFRGYAPIIVIWHATDKTK